MAKEKLNITLAKALGLSGIQVAPQTAELVIEIYEYVKKEGDFSNSKLVEIEKKVREKYPAPPPEPQQEETK